jgi:hypothetical protein
MRLCLCLAVLLGTCVVRAHADEPQHMFDAYHGGFPPLRAEWRSRHCWCPDDYCPKTLPVVPANAKGCADDYCPKKLPCVPCNPRGCVDDYCRKTCPLFLGRLCEPWYTCCPTQEGRAGLCPGCPAKP